MDIEAQRLENLRQKQKLLADLNLHSAATSKKDKDAAKAVSTVNDGKKSVKRRKIEVDTIPTRKSQRNRGSRPNYNENTGDRYSYTEPKIRSVKSSTRKVQTNTEEEVTPTDLRTLVPAADVESIQAGWTDWKPTGSAAVRDDGGTFHFDDHPRFTPNKSPEEMLHEGCFGGSYFRPLKSRKLGLLVQDDWKELPVEWYDGLDVRRFLVSSTYDPDVNKFKVSCGQSIEEWEAAGWISHKDDVRGWFQWYCRFWMGRRCDDDERQIGRWDRCVGKRGRWRRLLLKKYVQMGVREVFDYGDDEDKGDVSPVMHQTCHHWAYEVRQGDLEEAWQEFG